MKMVLYVPLVFQATHQLEEREEIHSHLWKVEVGVTGPVKEGRIVSLPVLKDLLMGPLTKLENTYLNENVYLDRDTRNFPTCEYLCQFLYYEYDALLKDCVGPQIKVESIKITVEEPDGASHGYCVLTV